MKIFHRKSNPDRRKESRRFHSGRIFYDYKSRLHRAELKNYSVSGIFIKAKDFFLKGERIDVAIPHADDKVDKYKGKIIWSDSEGCGVELLEEL